MLSGLLHPSCLKRFFIIIFHMDSMLRILVTDLLCRRISLYALKSWSFISCINGLVVQAMTDLAKDLVAKEGDCVSLRCSNLSSAENSVMWLYTPGEAYKGVQHIYTDGRMLSGWTSKCNVTTNATTSTLVLNAVRSDSVGYYECSEEHFGGYDVRFRVKLMVSEADRSAQYMDEMIGAFNNVIVTCGASAAAAVVACLLLILLVTLTQRRKNLKCPPLFNHGTDRRTIQGEMGNCETDDNMTAGSRLLLSQSAKPLHPSSSAQTSPLKVNLTGTAPPPGHEGA